ncbi:PTS glucose transporter subunit IIA [Enterococcus faecalis]|uniref:PTS sugar transporter subunit IIA n=1 Tax=Enterococcus faecalis TaxID=1351 RepID=UPI00288C66D5|nr:PTS glucose transporter subunit IIA [Enterococcus faecalis]MDT2155401.1 PTS glucose transporter subunit IIA [Enterococcus faecalis]
MFNLFKNKKQEGISITAPCSGRIIPISEVNDPIFSKKVLGEGFAVVPEGNKIYAPLTGGIEAVFPTKHAISIKSDADIEYLIHIGIDTVELEGKPFSIFVNAGEKVTTEKKVTTETLLAEVDFDQIKQAGKDPSVIVVFTKPEQVNEVILNSYTTIYGDSCGKIIL